MNLFIMLIIFFNSNICYYAHNCNWNFPRSPIKFLIIKQLIREKTNRIHPWATLTQTTNIVNKTYVDEILRNDPFAMLSFIN